jgi:hypothetical protein
MMGGELAKPGWQGSTVAPSENPVTGVDIITGASRLDRREVYRASRHIKQLVREEVQKLGVV